MQRQVMAWIGEAELADELPTQAALSRAMGWSSPATASEKVTRLERHGVVQRLYGIGRVSATAMRLTPLGWDLLQPDYHAGRIATTALLDRLAIDATIEDAAAIARVRQLVSPDSEVVRSSDDSLR